MKQPVTLALMQLPVLANRPAENLAAARKALASLPHKVDIVLFPEEFVNGPPSSLGLGGSDLHAAHLAAFVQLAREFSVAIVPGSFIEYTRKGKYNTTYYIDAAGVIKGKYRKIHLWKPERKYLAAGNRTCVVSTPFGKIGLGICWDLAFPEFFRSLVRRGAELVLLPSFWTESDAGPGLKHTSDSERVIVDSFCVARACENSIGVAFCNAAGEHTSRGKTHTLLGRSQVAVPFFGQVALSAQNDTDVVIATISPTVLSDAERAYRVRTDLKHRVF